jgi:hypothetical protein
MPVRATASYLGVKWQDVGLALGVGVRIGQLQVPTDRAMRLVVNYRGPRGTIPTYSFIDLLDGRIPVEKLANRIVLIGASLIGIADTNPAPFNNTPMPGTERMANVIDSLISGDFIRENPPPWPVLTHCRGCAARGSDRYRDRADSNSDRRADPARHRLLLGPVARSSPSITDCGCRWSTR